MISLGEELTVFPFVSEEYEKNFENHWSKILKNFFLINKVDSLKLRRNIPVEYLFKSESNPKRHERRKSG